MKLINTIMIINLAKPLWQIILIFILLFWLALTNGIAVYGLLLALRDRMDILSTNRLASRGILLTALGVGGIVISGIITLVCVFGILFNLVRIFCVV